MLNNKACCVSDDECRLDFQRLFTLDMSRVQTRTNTYSHGETTKRTNTNNYKHEFHQGDY